MQRVTHVESAIAEHFGSPQNFMPFLALHEFEAWLFSSPTELPRVMTESRKQAQFEAIRASVPTPEEINERPEFAPSKRIEALFPAYKKTLHGPTTAGAHRAGAEFARVSAFRRVDEEAGGFRCGMITELRFANGRLARRRHRARRAPPRSTAALFRVCGAASRAAAGGQGFREFAELHFRFVRFGEFAGDGLDTGWRVSQKIEKQ